MSTLHNGSHSDAITIVKSAPNQKCSSPNFPGYHAEVLHDIDAVIIVCVKEDNMDGALVEINRKLDDVSRWVGNHSVALAKDLHRLGCLHSILAKHQRCVQPLEESIHIGCSSNCNHDTLVSMKLLATTHDYLKDTEKAISGYKYALMAEKEDEGFAEKVKLMNAIANLCIQAGGKCQLAVDFLEKSLEIQQDSAFIEDKDADLLFDTMILYGNVMA